MPSAYMIENELNICMVYLYVFQFVEEF